MYILQNRYVFLMLDHVLRSRGTIIGGFSGKSSHSSSSVQWFPLKSFQHQAGGSRTGSVKEGKLKMGKLFVAARQFEK